MLEDYDSEQAEKGGKYLVRELKKKMMKVENIILTTMCWTS